jgi:hypothetical protein
MKGLTSVSVSSDRGQRMLKLTALLVASGDSSRYALADAGSRLNHLHTGIE